MDILSAIVLTAVIYMFFPLLRLCINRGKFDQKRARRIALWNSIIVGIFFYFLTSATLGSGTYWNATPAFLYYGINYFILADRKSEDEEDEEGKALIVVDEKVEKIVPAPKAKEKKKESKEESYFTMQSETGKKRKDVTGVLVTLVVCIVIGSMIGLILYNVIPVDNSTETAYPEYAKKWQVGIRMITLSDEFSAGYALAAWETGDANESTIRTVMNKYGQEPNSGNLQIVSAGELPKEVDEWCFSVERRPGDCAVIESTNGYNLCYYSEKIVPGETFKGDEIKGTLVVAVEENFPPYSWCENDHFYGFHVDVVKEYAKRENTDVEFIAVPFEKLVDSVTSGKCKMAFGINWTAERAEVVNFTIPYYDGMCAIYRKKEEKLTFSEWTELKRLEEFFSDEVVDNLAEKWGIPPEGTFSNYE